MNGDSTPPPPPGFDLTAPPPPSPGGAALSFQGQWNPETKQWEDVPVEGGAPPPPPGFDLTSAPEPPGPGAAERFARSFNQALTGYQGPADVLRDVKDNLWYELTRQRDTWEDTKNVWHGMKTQMDATWERAMEDAKNGNVTSLQGLINYTNSGIHMLESGVPVVGPLLAQADKQISNGDYAGGLGTMVGVGAMVAPEFMSGEVGGVTPGYAVHPGLAPEPFPAVGTAEGAAAPATGVARAAQLARGAADLGKDNVIGDVIGLASPRLRHAQNFLRHLADILDRYAQAPEEGPPAVPAEDIPESDAAIPADVYRQISRMYPQLNDRQIRGLGEEAMQQVRGQRIKPPEGIAAPPTAPEAAAPTPPPAAKGPTLEQTAIEPPAGRPEMAEPYREAQVVGVQGERAPSPPPEALKTYAGTPTTREESAAQWRAWQSGEGPPPPRPAPGQTSAEGPLRPAPPEHAAFGGAPGAEVPEGGAVPRFNQALDDNEVLHQLRENLAQAPYAEKYVAEPGAFGSKNKLFTQEQFKNALNEYDTEIEKMKSQRYAGVDPRPAMKAAIEVGGYYFEGGLRDFADWSKAMVSRLGEEIRPHLSALYSRLSEGLDSWGRQISTRNPTGENPTIDPLADNYRIDRQAIDNAEGDLPAKIADRLANAVDESGNRVYTGFKVDPNWTPKQTLDAFVKHTADNLTWLHDQVPAATRAVTARWYDSARRLAFEMADKHGYDTNQTAGVIAALSPQLDWNVNLSLADRITDIWTNEQKTRTTAGMISKAQDLAANAAKAAEKKPTAQRIAFAQDMAKLPEAFRGKSLSQITDANDQAWWVRIYDEAENDRSYNNYTPDGESMGPAKTTKGNLSTAAWNVPADNIQKAISILGDGSRENISAQLGNAHKVRNFYNNLLAPNDPAGHVTMDTHAVAAGQLKPLAGEDTAVSHNLSGPPKATNDGVTGFYGLYADAYRMAAKKLGIQPRQLQSITWEAARDLFPEDFKGNVANKDIITDIWKQYEDGELTAAQARKQIVKTTNASIKGRESLGAKLPTPEWVRWKESQGQ